MIFHFSFTLQHVELRGKNKKGGNNGHYSTQKKK